MPKILNLDPFSSNCCHLLKFYLSIINSLEVLKNLNLRHPEYNITWQNNHNNVTTIITFELCLQIMIKAIGK